MNRSRLLLLLSLTPMCSPSVWAGPEPVGPGEWKPYAERPALMPRMESDTTRGVLKMSANGNLRCNGSFRRTFAVDAGAFYRFSVLYRTEKVELPRRSVLAKIDWRDSQGKRVSEPEYPRSQTGKEDSWQRMEDLVRSPEGAVSATVDLIFRWDEEGTVLWKEATWKPAAPPAPREAVLATVNFRPRGSTGPEENLGLFARYLEEAGEKGADIVCLPEGITLVGTSRTYRDVAERVPGRTTAFLGKIARKHSMYIVAGLLEEDDGTVYNTAVLLDREGRLAGKYRKVSLPREEIEGGVTPGSDFPVFRTDFGIVGMMICWDVQFPEAARRLAAAGAEVILLPIWGGNELLFPARAIENQIYLVTSSYDAKTGIWDREGQMVAEAPADGTLTLFRVDLSQTTYWEWLGNYGARIPREAPPVREL